MKIFLVILILLVVFTVAAVIYDSCAEKQKKLEEQRRVFEAGNPDPDYHPGFIAAKLFSIDYTTRKLRPELVQDCRTIPFIDITGVQLVKDSQVIAETTNHGSLLNTFIGVEIAGTVGAIAGSTTGRRVTTFREQVSGWKLLLHTVHTHNATLEIDFPVGFRTTVTRNGSAEKLCGDDLIKALKWELEELDGCLDELVPWEGSDPVDELRRYKELLDDEIITKEEFQTIKKRLLRL